jgi:hypothetical protein
VTVLRAPSRRDAARRSLRKILRSIYGEARDVARTLAKTDAFEQSCRDRKRIEMLFAHLKRILARSNEIAPTARGSVRVHACSRRPEPASPRHLPEAGMLRADPGQTVFVGGV